MIKHIFTTNYLLFKRFRFISPLILLLAIASAVADFIFNKELPSLFENILLVLLWLDISHFMFPRFVPFINYAELTDYQKFLYNKVNK